MTFKNFTALKKKDTNLNFRDRNDHQENVCQWEQFNNAGYK